MRYWDRPWGLIQGCSPISSGCISCWSAARIREDNLDLPLKTKKPTVFSVWNDLITAYLYLWLERREKKRQLYHLAEMIGENRRLGYYD